MITIELLGRIWQFISIPESSAQKTEGRELDTIILPGNLHPLLTIDSFSQRHLLLPIEPDKDEFEDKESSGIHLSISEWGDKKSKFRCIDIVCLKPHLNELFDMVLFDILKDIEKYPDNLIQICKNVLKQWRELLYHEPGIVPDKSTLLGIFGELYILRELFGRHISSLKLWTGPFGKRYDFYSGKIALEVKSSTQRKGRTITVHGHDQLERPENGLLYLVYQKFEEVPNEGETIEGLIRNLIDLGCDKFKLWEALYNIKIYPDILPQCNSLRLKRLEIRVYEVNDTFPSIISRSFKGDTLPNHILSITYTIDLSGEPPFPLEEAFPYILSQLVSGL